VTTVASDLRPPGLTVLFADAHVIVVDKPPGMPSVPARTPLDPPAVATMLRDEYGPLEAVHRLDRDTSGLLVLSRSPAARIALGRSFEERAVQKRYEAIVCGVPAAAHGEIHLPLAPDPGRPPRHRVDPISGRIAITRWRLVERHEFPNGSRSLLDLEPVTGRSHQLRVHLAWLGVPIVGDRLYGPATQPAAAERLALHAAWLRFPHPADGRQVEIASPHGLAGGLAAAAMRRE
jgi:tRNA pseudouridine32 synthase/23S rRNA pseudouridine746 synthase